MRCFKSILVAIVLCLLGMNAFSQTDLATKLISGNYVLLMRHAYAPGVGDPAGYTLDKCESQRVLNAVGKQQALRTGGWLRKQGVTSAKVLSSPWCRCVETSERLKFGAVEIEPSLASFFDTPASAKSQNERLKTMIQKMLRQKSKSALILVTHHVNIAK